MAYLSGGMTVFPTRADYFDFNQKSYAPKGPFGKKARGFFAVQCDSL
jgi:hypothetical protein